MSKFHHIAISTTDFDKTVDFYKEVFGLKERCRFTLDDGRTGAMLWLTCGGIVEIFSGGTNEAETNPRLGHFSIAVDDVQATYKKAIELGAKPAVEPTELDIPSTPPLPVTIAFFYGIGGEYVELFKER